MFIIVVDVIFSMYNITLTVIFLIEWKFATTEEELTKECWTQERCVGSNLYETIQKRAIFYCRSNEINLSQTLVFWSTYMKDLSHFSDNNWFVFQWQYECDKIWLIFPITLWTISNWDNSYYCFFLDLIWIKIISGNGNSILFLRYCVLCRHLWCQWYVLKPEFYGKINIHLIRITCGLSEHPSSLSITCL